MAEAEKVMGVSTGDIEKIMGVATGDIEKIIGVEFPAGLQPYQGNTAFFMGGTGLEGGSSGTTTADTFTLAVMSTGDASDAGDLSEEFYAPAASGSNVSNGNRIVLGGGANGDYSNTIHYFAPASWSGGSTDFGNLVESRIWCEGASNGTIGMIGMGHA